MGVFAIGIERPLDVAVQRHQHPDARMHQEVAAFGGADQAGHRGLLFLEVLLSLWKLHDVIGSIAQSHQIEATSPGGGGLQSCDRLSAFRDVLKAQLAFFSSASAAAISGQIVLLF